jgi:hypothetical protein
LMAANAAIKLVYDLLIAAGDASVAPDRVTWADTKVVQLSRIVRIIPVIFFIKIDF